jgi:hypothetical protein
LSGARYSARFILSLHLIGCSLPSSNWLTTFWFLIGFGSPAAQQ